jgi:C-terminal processing protease CtpA/Prc
LASAQTRIKELQSKLTLQAKQLAGAEDERVKAVNAAVKKALDDAGEAAAEEVRTQLLAKEEQHVVAICSLKSEHAKEKKSMEAIFRKEISQAVKHYHDAHVEVLAKKENEIAVLNEDLKFSGTAKGMISNILSPLVSPRPSKRRREEGASELVD